MKVSRSNVSFDLLRVPRTDDGAGHDWISKRPRDRDLARRTSVAIRDYTQAFNQRKILRKLRIMKLNIPTSPITRREIRGAFARHCAGEQSRRHRRINDHADSARSTVRQNLWFDFPAD
jgi:hypothetical protein